MKHKKNKIYNSDNLIKNLNLYIYKIYYINFIKNKKIIFNYFKKKYNKIKIKNIIKKILKIINYKIINLYIKKNNFKKINIIILIKKIKKKNNKNNNIISNINKNYIFINIYQENNFKKNIIIIKIDINIYIYGSTTVLKLINYLISKFKSDLIIIDYKIRGFSINIKNKKIFIDNKINSIQNFISKKNKNIYDLIDINIYNENIFYTKMIKKKININKNILYIKKLNLNKKKKKKIIKIIWKEIKEIYYRKNY